VAAVGSGVTRDLSQGRGKLREGPTNRRSFRSCYDAEKSEPVVCC